MSKQQQQQKHLLWDPETQRQLFPKGICFWGKKAVLESCLYYVMGEECSIVFPKQFHGMYSFIDEIANKWSKNQYSDETERC